MVPRTHALLVCALFLCGTQEAVLARRGRCAGNQCLALFDEPEDFAGARRSCRDSGGELFVFGSEDSVKHLVPVGGSYWVEVSSTAPPGPRMCSSVAVWSREKLQVSWLPCHRTLDGFLCQYTVEEPCGGLEAGGGAHTNYTAHMDFEVHDSESYPPGTIAVTVNTGGKYPEAKHVCVSGRWMRAPWSCEVLRGGCVHDCSSATHACTCPTGKVLHSNNITCVEGACESNPCTGEGRECQNTAGGFTCTCRDGFVEEDGACVDVTVCETCEHMLCDKTDGVYRCACRKGFQVSARDPAKCEVTCKGRDCPSQCIKNDQDQYQCFCPNGYVLDIKNGTRFCTDINECEFGQCDHQCENLFGGFRCSCDAGFRLDHDKYSCVPVREDEEEELGGSGSTPGPPYPTPAGAAVPSYVKTGSALGITVFMALCAVLLCFLIRSAFRRCGKFELSSFKHPQVDIFYVQQVTTGTYKRLSFDKQSRCDSGTL